MRYDNMNIRTIFSIILPVYNVEKYLGACLDSIYNQTFQDFEIIAVNDGSTDGSLDILNDYRDKYGKMIIVSQDNKGLSSARNVGLSFAKGEWICYIDSDDIILPRMLEIVHSYFDGAVDIVAYNHIYVDEEFELRDYNVQHTTTLKYIKGCGKDIYLSLSNDNKYFNAVWRMCVRRTYLDKIGIAFVEGIFYEDVIYTLTCYLKSKYMVYIDVQLYIYRKRMGAITYSGKCAKAVSSYVSVLAQMIDYLCDEKYEIEIEKCVLNNIGRGLIKELSSKLYLLKDYKPIWKANVQPYGQFYTINIRACKETSDYQYYIKGFERIVRKSKMTIVYGAGGIARLLGQYFKKKNMLDYINSYCVTEKKEEMQIEGIEVREIEYIKNFDKDILIIIAANATASDMERKITEYGYYNYIVVDRLLEGIIYDILNS